MLDNISLHHIGVVVNKISNDSANFQNFIEASDISLPFDDVFQKVRVAFLDVYPIKIEFIEPLNIDSPVCNFLNFGGGIHHIAFETDSLEKTKEKLLTFFGSVKQIKESNRNEIEKLIGKGKTATLLLSLKKK